MGAWRHDQIAEVHLSYAAKLSEEWGPPLSAVKQELGMMWSKQEVRMVVGYLDQVVASLYPELQIYLRQDRAWKERHFQNIFDAVALAIYYQKTRRRS